MAYEVFISFKNTASGGGLTVDRTIAERLHMKLRDEGLEVFFSEKDLSSSEFMDQIYQALDEARVLILVGTSVEYVNSEWVKSEWSTFFGSMKSGRKPDGHILTVLHGITPRNLPIQLEPFESFSADDLDSAVAFTFKTLGKVRKSEAAARLAEEQERQRKAAEEAAVLEMQKRMEAERKAEREHQQRVAAEQKSNQIQQQSEKQSKTNRVLRTVAMVLTAALLVCFFGMFAYQQIEASKADDIAADFELIGPASDNGVATEFTILHYTGNSKNVVIPGKIYGDPVIRIESAAFMGRKDITSVKIPESITSIGYDAFEGCTVTVYAPHEPSYYGYVPDTGVTWIVK